ncbi:MAG TPA: hypothetical protein VH593_20955 [Ktedonobacteraceae bacterium]
MFDPRTILTQVSHNEAREGWLVRRAKGNPRAVAIGMGIFTMLIIFPMLMFITLIIFDFSASNPLPFLLSSPWMILPALFLSAAFVFMCWNMEKKNCDGILILLPEGIVECEHWHDEKKRRIESFAYAELEKVMLKDERGDISFQLSAGSQLHIEDCIPQIHSGYPVFEFVYRDGRRKKWSVVGKYLFQDEKDLVQHIIVDYTSYFSMEHVISGSRQVNSLAPQDQKER